MVVPAFMFAPKTCFLFGDVTAAEVRLVAAPSLLVSFCWIDGVLDRGFGFCSYCISVFCIVCCCVSDPRLWVAVDLAFLRWLFLINPKGSGSINPKGFVLVKLVMLGLLCLIL